MGVPTSDVGYTSATHVWGDHEVHKGHVVALEKKNFRRVLNVISFLLGYSPTSVVQMPSFRNILKYWHLNYSHRGITQKEAYDTLNFFFKGLKIAFSEFCHVARGFFLEYVCFLLA
jgi:hypothetical protein